MFVTFDCSKGQFYELVGRFALNGTISVKNGYHENTHEFVSQTWRMGYNSSSAYFDGPEVFVNILKTLGYNPEELPF